MSTDILSQLESAEAVKYAAYERYMLAEHQAAIAPKLGERAVNTTIPESETSLTAATDLTLAVVGLGVLKSAEPNRYTPATEFDTESPEELDETWQDFYRTLGDRALVAGTQPRVNDALKYAQEAYDLAA